MERRKFIGAAAAVAGSAAVGQAFAATDKQGDLVRVRSRHLDEVLRKPNADFGTYRKVRLEAIRAEADPGWVKSINYSRKGGAKLDEADAKKLAEAGAASLARALVGAFSANGYELVKEPGPGVMNVTASATNLYLNAPESFEAGTRSVVTDEVGKATLRLEGRDAVTGNILLQTTHKGIARTVDASRATNVTNRFHFDALFAQWAAHVVQEIK